MPETRNIDYAISLLGRCEAKLNNVARHSDDYRFLAELRSVARDAQKESDALHRNPVPVVRSDQSDFEPEHLECFCNASNAPCSWCETHCVECSEHIDECECN